ncbi:hypothetical protein QIS99_03240 [Streptomyces sp. B-S-A8]|uniref:Uncharacterized protein n=1 Tax=Streptomyces solicavernae TaxID=3043614 RepID=A0ABT6RLD6_9ACTN|nr:hypothetical protein [Streptomyces sp. B-S-A8]MDI3385237.1 hypothetical protein [Streptomyces sp. B-S-A8]
MNKKTRVRAKLNHGGEQIWTVRYSDQPPWQVQAEAPDGASFSAAGDDLFRALQQVRRDLEAKGTILCCNGARSNAHPSPAASEHGAELVYLVPARRPACSLDLAPLLAPAPSRVVVSVSEQERRWQRIQSTPLGALRIANPIGWWKKIDEAILGLRQWVPVETESGFVEWQSFRPRRGGPGSTAQRL